MDKKFLLLIVLSALVFFANIGGTSIYILDEAKNAGCAMEMFQQGEWIVPTFNGELRFDKPPLHYFFMRAAYGLFGITPFAARFFSSVMGVLLISVMYFFGKRALKGDASFYACLIMISSLQVAFQFHLAVPDPYLLFFWTTGLLCFYEAVKNGEDKFVYGTYVSLALATLAKGLVALLLPGLTGFIFLLTQKKLSWDVLRQIKLLQGFMIAVLILIPWYAMVHIETGGEWTNRFFWKHNVDRFTKTMEGHGGFPLASFVITIAALLPYSLFFPPMLRRVWAIRRKKPFLLYCLLAVLVVAGFFALSRTILPSYIGPALPFFAFMLGYYFERAVSKSKAKNMWTAALVNVLVTCAFPLAVYFALKQDQSLQHLTSVSWWFILLPISAVVGFWYILKGKVREALFVYSSGSILLLLIFFYWIYPQIDKQNPVTQSLKALRDHQAIEYYHRDFNPAFVFALQRPLHSIEPDSIKKGDEILLVTQQRYVENFTNLETSWIYAGKDLFEKPETVVLEVTR
jgi:4-amino-4-deoxy-L-arabinose transferase-like glycosyltransferase